MTSATTTPAQGAGGQAYWEQRQLMTRTTTLPGRQQADDLVLVVGFQDGRSSTAATAPRL